MLNNVDPAVRQKIYQGLAVLGLVLGTIQVVFASLGLQDSAWLTASLAAFAYVSAAVGYTAQANTNTFRTGDPAPEVAPEDPEFVEESEDV